MRYHRKIIGSEVLFRTGIHKLIARRYGGIGVILALHSVVENPENYLMGNHLPASVFDKIMGGLTRRGFEFVTMDAVLDRLRDDGGGRFAALTFDDGFRDNLTVVPRILEKYSAPFTSYVTTQMVTRELDAWWLGLQKLFLQWDAVDLEPMGQRFVCESRCEKITAFEAAAKWVHSDYQRGAEIENYLKRRGCAVADVLDQIALDRDDVIELSHHPLATIGGHTTSHPALRELDSADARAEIADNKVFLESLIGEVVDHFAYPFGDALACNERDAAIVTEIEFRSAVTTRHGTLFAAHRESPYALPRVGVHPSDTVATMINKSSGVYRFFQTRGGSPVVRM